MWLWLGPLWAKICFTYKLLGQIGLSDGPGVNWAASNFQKSGNRATWIEASVWERIFGYQVNPLTGIGLDGWTVGCVLKASDSWGWWQAISVCWGHWWASLFQCVPQHWHEWTLIGGFLDNLICCSSSQPLLPLLIWWRFGIWTLRQKVEGGGGLDYIQRLLAVIRELDCYKWLRWCPLFQTVFTGRTRMMDKIYHKRYWTLLGLLCLSMK